MTAAAKRHDAINRLAVDLANFFPVGTEVLYVEDDGRETPAATRSDAWQLPSGHAVIMLNGRSGCVSLERVKYTQEAFEKAKAERW